MLASMLGFFLTIVILSFIFFIVVVSVIALATTEEVSTPRNCILQIRLDRPISDRSPNNPFLMDFSSFTKKNGLTDILSDIHKAKDDNNIKGILLDVSVIPAGLSTIGEIRDALLDFKKSGKFIVSYSEFYSQGAYYLASVADLIYLQPQGMILFKGLDAEVTFIKGTLDKLDIKMQIMRHGKFKAATEPLFLDKMSPENRKQLSELVTRSWSTIVKGISASRGISTERLNQIADSLKAEVPAYARKMPSSTSWPTVMSFLVTFAGKWASTTRSRSILLPLKNIPTSPISITPSREKTERLPSFMLQVTLLEVTAMTCQ